MNIYVYRAETIIFIINYLIFLINGLFCQYIVNFIYSIEPNITNLQYVLHITPSIQMRKSPPSK